MTLTRLGSILMVIPLLSCMSASPKIQTVQAPTTDKKIPLGIVLHPLLSSQAESGWARMGCFYDGGDRESIYIRPPVKTTMQVTGTSERMTGLLNMELTRRGFKLSELPVEAPVEGESAFAVSLALLDELRVRNNVHAILIGNAFFTGANRYGDAQVTDLYLKVVDVETLEVLGQVALSHDALGWPMDRVAYEVADQLAAGAGLPTSTE